MFAAFKIKPVVFVEKLIKFFTGSDVVHCEIVTQIQRDQFYGYTSMPFYGVTQRWVEYNDDEWSFVLLPEKYTCADLTEFYEKTKGKKYDYLGCLGFVFGNKDDPQRYFCSEWCAEFLGCCNPAQYTPELLMRNIQLL